MTTLTNPHGTGYVNSSGEKVQDKDLEPDWTRCCDNCGEIPIVPFTGLCGPCTFGEADTIGGNW